MDSKPLKEQVVTKPFKYTEERVIEALKAANGNKSATARMLNCNRCTIDEYVKRSDRIREVYEAEVQGIIDESEDRLTQLMRQDDDRRVSFRSAELIVTTRGKDRGWAKHDERANNQQVQVINNLFPEIKEKEPREVEVEED